MIFRFNFIFLTLSLLIFAENNISSSFLNSELKQNYSFIERSLNQSDLKINTSSGNIYFDEEGITVNVISPFEENYRIEGDIIEIHDVFLDQKQIINIKDLDNFFLNILINGVDEASEDYKINFLNGASIEVIQNDSLHSIKFLFVNKNLSLIRYIDSIGVEHGIELKKI
tara:strand:+ start:2426 stop:2935 length:510 start_codon:yes stop_codon:yes gene_type:complete